MIPVRAQYLSDTGMGTIVVMATVLAVIVAVALVVAVVVAVISRNIKDSVIRVSYIYIHSVA